MGEELGFGCSEMKFSRLSKVLYVAVTVAATVL